MILICFERRRDTKNNRFQYMKQKVFSWNICIFLIVIVTVNGMFSVPVHLSQTTHYM